MQAIASERISNADYTFFFVKALHGDAEQLKGNNVCGKYPVLPGIVGLSLQQNVNLNTGSGYYWPMQSPTR